MDNGSDGAMMPHNEIASLSENQSVAIDIMLISEVAAVVGLEPKTIRFYERAKLLSPRRHGRIRIYRRNDVDNLLGIKKLRQYGVAISKIRTILQDEGNLSLATLSSEPMQNILQLHLEDMRKKHIFFLEQMEDLKSRLQQKHAATTSAEQSLDAPALQMHNEGDNLLEREI
jgi:DNA-binding transcriptional MerR regulator